VLERGARLRDLQRNTPARIARTGQRQTLAERYCPSIDLQMRAPIILEKTDNELGAVGAAIALERGLPAAIPAANNAAPKFMGLRRFMFAS